MSQYRIFFGFVPLLLLANCAIYPIVFQEGLPAYVPHDRGPEYRAAVNGAYLFDIGVLGGERTVPYFFGGLRQGWLRGPLAYEVGAQTFVLSTGAMAGPEFAFGLHDPALLLRLSLYPVSVGSSGVNLDPRCWWQVQALVGTSPKPKKWNWTVGVGASNFYNMAIGIGPTAVVEVPIGKFRLRGQTSFSFRPPWADTLSVYGQVFSLGVTGAYQP